MKRKISDIRDITDIKLITKAMIAKAATTDKMLVK